MRQVKWESLPKTNWLMYKQVEIFHDQTAPSGSELVDEEFPTDENESDTEACLVYYRIIFNL